MRHDLAAYASWLQLNDSALPSGRMAHSNGIESWLHHHSDSDDGALEQLIVDYVANSIATLDAVATAAAWRATTVGELIDIDQRLLSYKTSQNGRTSSQSAGRQITATIRKVGLVKRSDYLDAVVKRSTPGNIAVVEGAVQSLLGIPQDICVLGSLRSAMSLAISVCVRLGCLGALVGQRILVRNNDVLVSLAGKVLATPLSELASHTIELELRGMQHEPRTSRFFAS